MVLLRRIRTKVGFIVQKGPNNMHQQVQDSVPCQLPSPTVRTDVIEFNGNDQDCARTTTTLANHAPRS